MGNIIINNPPEFKIIPELLKEEFNGILMEAYFDGGWHDLHNLTDHVDIFSVYSASFKETGDPYVYSDDDSREMSNKHIITSDFGVLMEDVAALLNYHKMFHSWMDKGINGAYKYIGCVNIPIREVW